MKPMEFQTTLTGGQTLEIPAEIAAKLPEHGTATVILVVDGEPDEREWLESAQQQFLRDDSEADASCDRYL